MDRRTGLILLLVMALLAVPVLCLGGVLEHTCACHQGPFGHDMCPDDPCDQVICSDESDGSGPDLPAPALLALAPAVDPDPALREQRPRRRPTRPPRRALPYHESDVPRRV